MKHIENSNDGKTEVNNESQLNGDTRDFDQKENQGNRKINQSGSLRSNDVKQCIWS